MKNLILLSFLLLSASMSASGSTAVPKSMQCGVSFWSICDLSVCSPSHPGEPNHLDLGTVPFQRQSDDLYAATVDSDIQFAGSTYHLSGGMAFIVKNNQVKGEFEAKEISTGLISRSSAIYGAENSAGSISYGHPADGLWLEKNLVAQGRDIQHMTFGCWVPSVK
jgi:hypothetical protein